MILLFNRFSKMDWCIIVDSPLLIRGVGMGGPGLTQARPLGSQALPGPPNQIEPFVVIN